MLPAAVLRAAADDDVAGRERRRRRSSSGRTRHRGRRPAIFVVVLAAPLVAISSLLFEWGTTTTTTTIKTTSSVDVDGRSSTMATTGHESLERRGRRRRRLRDDDDDGNDDGPMMPMDESEFIIRRSYAETYGRMPRCGEGVTGKECIALAAERVIGRGGDGGGGGSNNGSGSSSSSSVAPPSPGGGNGNDNDNDVGSSSSSFRVPDDHPYPWWFVTLLRDVRGNGAYGPWHNLDASDPKLRFCAIGKNGCTEWRRVFKALNAPEYCGGGGGGGGGGGEDDEDGEDEEWGERRVVDVCDASRFNTRISLDGGDRVPNTVFLRDPLERLLSGYLDKCAKPNIRASQGHCEPNEVFGADHLLRKKANIGEKREGSMRRGGANTNTTTTTTTSMGKRPVLPPDATAVVRDLEREMFAAYVDLLPLKWNVHFVPQAFTCDLYRTIRTYDFVGIMGRGFAYELDRMAQRYGGTTLPDALDSAFGYRSKIGRKDNGTTTTTTTTTTADVFGSDKAHGTKASAKVYRYYSPRAVRRGLEYLSIDYVTLGLEVPDWAREILRDDE